MSNATSNRFFTVAVVDTNGLLRGQKIRAADLKGVLENGVGMSPVQLALDPTDVILPMPGISDDDSDFHDNELKVDAASRFTMPFEAAEDSSLYLAGFTGDAGNFCPRSLLQRVIAKGADMGFSPKVGVELEFTLFNETSASLAEKGFDNLTTATAHPSHDLIIYQNAQSDFYGEVADLCDTLGIDLAKMHEEIGGGFMEACVGPVDALAGADHSVLLKNFMRVLAMRKGQTICYMPRWSEEADSQSSHIHMSLLGKDGAPSFWDENGTHNISDNFRHFLGGLQKYLPEVMLIFAPTVNSWRRFAEGTFAPPAFSWGFENRTTCLRVVGGSRNSLRVENRLPCSDSNPHLAIAAMFAAGLAGIENRIEPEEETTGNGYNPEAAKGRPLPTSMSEAIGEMRASQFAQDWLGPRFVETFTATREAQVAEFKGKTLIDERRRFFELG